MSDRLVLDLLAASTGLKSWTAPTLFVNPEPGRSTVATPATARLVEHRSGVVQACLLT
jgi:hypothetical protein